MASRRRKGRKTARRAAKARPRARAAPRAAKARPKRARAAPRAARKVKRKTAPRKPRPAASRSPARVARGARALARAKREPARAAVAAAPSKPTRERLAAGVPVEIGVVVHWFPRRSAAVVALSHPLRVGDTIHVRGQTTDLVQQVASLARDGAAVREGAPPDALGVRLEARARPGDRVYRVSW